MTIQTRQAAAADSREIIRLRRLMYAAMDDRSVVDDGWEDAARRLLETELAAPHPALMVFVIEADDATLASCATGMLQQRLPGPGNPTGRVGYVSNVCTDDAYRRRGYARACVEALNDWFSAQRVARIDLSASGSAEPLYASLGFQRTPNPVMRLKLT